MLYHFGVRKAKEEMCGSCWISNRIAKWKEYKYTFETNMYNNAEVPLIAMK